MANDAKKVVLAYSGGLDTSVILKWLEEQGYEVIAFIGNVGQDEDFEAARKKALQIGASQVFLEDLRETFVRDFVFPVFKANARYEGRYLLGTALARPLLARRQIEIANEVGADSVAHGATGKGNDQVRFELAYHALKPGVNIIAPWKMDEFLGRFKGRPDLIAYADSRGIPVGSLREKPFSEDDNLLHISHESGVLEDPGAEPPEDAWSRTTAPEKAPDKPTRIEVEFKDGIPVRLTNLDDGTTKTGALELFEYANRLGCENGVGRLDMVENRFVGIKSRGIYETPGGAILHAAHEDVEGIAMDREVLRLRDMLATKLTELVYNGFWFSPEMDFIMSAIDKSQEVVDGQVRIKLYKGNVIVTGRESTSSLYDQDLASMDIEGGFNQKDAEGFIRIHALRLMAHGAIMHRKHKHWGVE